MDWFLFKPKQIQLIRHKLNQQVNEIQEDMKLRESRWSAAATRYKDRITNLEKENKEIKEEVKLLEKQNLELQRKDQQKVCLCSYIIISNREKRTLRGVYMIP